VAVEAGTSSSKDDITGGSAEAERNKLVFFEGGIYSFDLEDLLRASAEVLGKGSVGTSYKAVLEEGTTVVVKRLKDVVVTKRDFETQMEVLGKIKHDNVVPLRAYYYSKDEKLLVSDFMPVGSLSALLHGMVSDFFISSFFLSISSFFFPLLFFHCYFEFFFSFFIQNLAFKMDVAHLMLSRFYSICLTKWVAVYSH
jgi:hypothetical protein